MSTLGTSSGVPTKARGVTTIGVRYGAEHWLVDCGEGTQNRLRTSATMNISRINRIFITHMHGDHTWGLLGVIASNLIGNDTPSPLTIYGPPGLNDFIFKALKSTYTAYPSGLLRIHELGGRDSPNFPNSEGVFTILDQDNFQVRASLIKHTIPCFGYVFEEKTKRGKIDMAALLKFGVPHGPQVKAVQAQWERSHITLPGIIDENTGLEKIVKREEVMSRPILGRKVVILGDTSDPYDIAPIAQDACLLIHECTLPSGMEKTAVPRGHSTGSMGAKFAQHINARGLVFTHFSPRFTDEMIEEELKKVEPIYSHGETFMAADYDVFDLPVRETDSDVRVTRYKYPFEEIEPDPEKDFNEAIATTL